MKKGICLILSIIVALSAVLAACSGDKNKDDKNTQSTSDQGLDSAVNDFGFVNVEVTDENGEVVTNAKGEKETTEIAVELSTDKEGNTVGYEIDKNGERVTDKKGNEVTVKPEMVTTNPNKPSSTDSQTTNNTSSSSNENESSNNNDTTEANGTTSNGSTQNDTTNNNSTSVSSNRPTASTTDRTTNVDDPTVVTVTTSSLNPQPTTESTTMTTKREESTTSSELTTYDDFKKDKVPKTTDEGIPVIFSAEDQQIIKSMLEVPYLYEASYENEEGVPINIARHAAIWMVQRESLNTTSYASATVVLDLFNYFAQTVVNFKTHCNEVGNENIQYVSTNDTFTISAFEEPTHTVTLTGIEFLGNNNYYKVTAKVSGTKKAKSVVAVIQKNMLDSTLGFSIKALQWS